MKENKKPVITIDCDKCGKTIGKPGLWSHKQSCNQKKVESPDSVFDVNNLNHDGLSDEIHTRVAKRIYEIDELVKKLETSRAVYEEVLKMLL